MPKIDQRDGINMGDRERLQLEKHRLIRSQGLPEFCRVDVEGDGAMPKAGTESDMLTPSSSPRSSAPQQANISQRIKW